MAKFRVGDLVIIREWDDRRLQGRAPAVRPCDRRLSISYLR